MASIAIPVAYRDPLLRLARLPQEDADRLIEALAGAAAFAPVRELEKRVTDALAAEDGVVAGRLMSALLSLAGQFRTTMPPERLAEGLSASPALDLDADERNQLNTRLEALIGAKSLFTTASAVELLTQHDRNYQTARIVTDVRPVFDDPSKAPAGAVLVQMLQVFTWDREGQREPVYVAMDRWDLEELRGVIDRALEKTRTLEEWLDKQGIVSFKLDPREL